MSGMTRSTPRSSDSGNIMPASMTMMSSPSRNTIMFMPNSPSPPRGMAVSDWADLLAVLPGVLLKEESTPALKRESYHTVERCEGRAGLVKRKLLSRLSDGNRQRKDARSRQESRPQALRQRV